MFDTIKDVNYLFSWLVLASLAAKKRTAIPAKIAFAGGNASPTPWPTVAENRIQYIHGWDDPFCESIVSILGLIESRYLASQDGEDSLGGITRRIEGWKGAGARLGLS